MSEDNGVDVSRETVAGPAPQTEDHATPCAECVTAQRAMFISGCALGVSLGIVGYWLIVK